MERTSGIRVKNTGHSSLPTQRYQLQFKRRSKPVFLALPVEQAWNPSALLVQIVYWRLYFRIGETSQST